MKKGLLYFITMCGVLVFTSCGISENKNSEQGTAQQMTEKSQNLEKKKEAGITKKTEKVLKIAIDAGHQEKQNSELCRM